MKFLPLARVRNDIVYEPEASRQCHSLREQEKEISMSARLPPRNDIVKFNVKSLLNKPRKGNLNSNYSEECYFQRVTFLIVSVNKFCLTLLISFLRCIHIPHRKYEVFLLAMQGLSSCRCHSRNHLHAPQNKTMNYCYAALF